MPNFVSVIEALPAQVIFVAVLPVYMGVNGVWASSVLGGITTFLALTIAVACQNRRRPRTLKAYLLFPKSIDRTIIDSLKASGRHPKLGKQLHDGINYAQIEEIDNAVDRADAVRFCSLAVRRRACSAAFPTCTAPYMAEEHGK